MATVGELTNVPEPGAPIRSPWAQDVSERIIHRFASKAALDAGWASPPDGAVAYLQDLDYVALRAGGVWRLLYPSEIAYGQTTLGGTIITTDQIIGDINVASLSFPYRARYMIQTTIVAATDLGAMRVRANTTGAGASVSDPVVQAQHWDAGARAPLTIVGHIDRPAGGPLRVHTWVQTQSGTASVTGDPLYDRFNLFLIGL